MPEIVENKTECMNYLMSPGFSAVSLKIGMHKAEKTAQRYSTRTKIVIRFCKKIPILTLLVRT
jgi:hypothetical protein